MPLWALPVTWLEGWKKTSLHLVNFVVACVWLKFSVCFPASAASYCSWQPGVLGIPHATFMAALLQRTNNGRSCVAPIWLNLSVCTVHSHTDVGCNTVLQLVCAAAAVITAFLSFQPRCFISLQHLNLLRNTTDSIQHELCVPVPKSSPFTVLIMLAFQSH